MVLAEEPMRKMSGLALILLACLVSACIPESGQQTTVSLETQAVTPEIGPTNVYPPLTPATCTPLSSGMALSSKPVSPTAIQINMSGLQPGESLILILRSQRDGYSFQMEGHPVLTADSNGRFVYVVHGLSSPAGTKHWMIQVVHSRGVACTSVDMP